MVRPPEDLPGDELASILPPGHHDELTPDEMITDDWDHTLSMIWQTCFILAAALVFGEVSGLIIGRMH